MSLELAMISPHTPRICHKDKVAAFQQPLVDAMVKTADLIESLHPDVIVLVSCHWQSSFTHYVDATPRHKGVLTAVECPDIITDVHYDFQGHPELAQELVESGKSAGLKVESINDETYMWDYGTVVPLRYLVKGDIPIVDLSVCQAASLEETTKWGAVMAQVFQETQLRVVFIASGALAHNLRRGPEFWPNITEQALDREFCSYLVKGDTESAAEMLPSYVRAAGVEAGGRHVAMLLGVLQGNFAGRLHGYGPSSGSGNPVLTMQPVGATIS
ncbi:extradiol ring-cleavage dioxygenase [Alicyclobacillus sp. SO9]|uniref:DODA-type extradiol aromatic ring-opening family dioxygenase n=1 Tax=Alicyclobacillus sp. SO9 TaxID=2665646 RepID=UPI0018E8903C|nr:extradiol ring-cleavage dioxygenase [Alicyclobacillus sp. SO9]QQE77725.1 extradiol ring-cleavage dioxygenase [Alicyclobacillus sp. SO9]